MQYTYQISPGEARLIEMFEPALDDMGYTLVRVKLGDIDNRKTLQIMLDRNDGEPVNIGDCETVSKALSLLLDVEDPIDGEYNLEVSSPGLDRPLTRPADFEEFKGHMAKVELYEAIEGSKRFKGTLVGNEEDVALLQVGETVVSIPHANIKKAKLDIDGFFSAANQNKKKQ